MLVVFPADVKGSKGSKSLAHNRLGCKCQKLFLADVYFLPSVSDSDALSNVGLAMSKQICTLSATCKMYFLQFQKCISLNCKMYFFKLQNVFVCFLPSVWCPFHRRTISAATSTKICTLCINDTGGMLREETLSNGCRLYIYNRGGWWNGWMDWITR